MQTTLKIALISIVLIFILLILISIKRKKMNITFSIFWLVVGAGLIFAVLVPHLIENISNFLGFETTANMLFCITIFIAFYLIFNLMLIASKEYEKSTILVQEVSLLKKKVEELENHDFGNGEKNHH